MLRVQRLTGRLARAGGELEAAAHATSSLDVGGAHAFARGSGAGGHRRASQELLGDGVSGPFFLDGDAGHLAGCSFALRRCSELARSGLQSNVVRLGGLHGARLGHGGCRRSRTEPEAAAGRKVRMSFIREKARMVSERGVRDRAALRSGGNQISALRVIPVTAWVIAFAVYICFALVMWLVALPTDKEMRLWQPWRQALFAFGFGLVFLVWIPLIGYVNGDARRRRMRYVMWTFLAIFIPNFIGIILYFLLRDPLPRPCPVCGKTVDGSFSFCPYCSAGLGL